MAKDIYVINNSDHPLKFLRFQGNTADIFITLEKEIPSKNTIKVGVIKTPDNVVRPHFGWLLVQDVINKATFELYVYIAANTFLGIDHDSVGVGLLSNTHDRYLNMFDKPNNPISNPANQYLEGAKDDNSFTLTIRSTWTDKPPSYIFNYGLYQISPDIASIDLADHSFIVVRSFNGDKIIKFHCWGDAIEEPTRKYPTLWYPAATFLGNEYNLALARAICCFDPNYEGKRVTNEDPNYEGVTNEYARHEEGELILGDCCGIIYGRTGVCHMMANRICAAVAGVDVGAMAGASGYMSSPLGSNFCSNTYFGRFGGGKPQQIDPKALVKIIVDVIIDNEDLDNLGITENSPLYLKWEDYFAECKKKVESHYKRRKY